jgi:GNAT superfamily N-acetyltransferase
MTTFTILGHDSPPPEAVAIVDRALGEANDAAAPLHEVAPIACIARDREGRVIGGAIGRWWGDCAGLQQLWVHEGSRGRGAGRPMIAPAPGPHALLPRRRPRRGPMPAAGEARSGSRPYPLPTKRRVKLTAASML